MFILDVVEGGLGALADVAENSGGVLGEQDAKILSLQIQALSASIPGLAAAAEENPFYAIRSGTRA